MSKYSKPNPAKDIEELERRLKNWTFIQDSPMNDDLVNLQQCHEILHGTDEIQDGEAEMKLLAVEVQDLIGNLRQNLAAAKHKVTTGKMKVELASQEAQNKILYKMDSEDIRSSLWKLVISRERLRIFEEAEQVYSCLVESLNDMVKLEQSHWTALRQNKAVITPYSRTVVGSESSRVKELMPIQKVLSSQFYEMKVRAKLCYEEQSRKTLELSRRLFDAHSFDAEIIREHSRQQAYLALNTVSVAIPTPSL
jgi:hypothetical protein